MTDYGMGTGFANAFFNVSLMGTLMLTPNPGIEFSNQRLYMSGISGVL